MSYYLPDEKTAPGWYTFVFLDGNEKSDSIYAYFLDPDKYAEHLADCGISSMYTSYMLEEFPDEMNELLSLGAN